MPEFSEDLVEFKARIDEKYDHVKKEIVEIESEIQELKARKNQKSIQAITEDDHHIDRQIGRLQELLVILRDHKKRLGTQVLRLGSRNPGLLQPEFEER